MPKNGATMLDFYIVYFSVDVYLVFLSQFLWFDFVDYYHYTNEPTLSYLHVFVLTLKSNLLWFPQMNINFIRFQEIFS